MPKSVDVLVIGAGVAGISAAIYLKRSSLSFAILDKGAPGGKLNNIHLIDNYPGTPSISGADLAMTLFAQAMNLGINFDYGDVVSVSRSDEGFLVDTDNGSFMAKAVIVASGTSMRNSGAKGEKEYLGKGVSYCATCDGNFFKGKDMAVIGYKDNAIEEAIYLAGLASRLYVVSPKEIECTKSHLDTLSSFENVVFLKEYSLKEIKGEENVSSIVLKKGEEEKEIEVSACFPLSGEKSSVEFLYSLGIENNKGFIKVDPDMNSSVRGIYAAGDIVDKKLRQVVTAASDGAIAATSAIQYVYSLRKAR